MWKPILKGTALGTLLGLIAGGVVAGVPGALVGAGVGFVPSLTFMLFAGATGAFSDRYPRLKKHVEFDCPHSRRHVDAVVHFNPESEEVLDVCSCSRFEPRAEVRCKQACVEDLNEGVVESQAVTA